MRALETDYRVKLDEIARKESLLKLPDNPLPSFEERIQSRKKVGLDKLVASDADYKTWLQQKTVLQGDRINKMVTERSATILDMKAKVSAQREQQRAADIKLVGNLFYGVPNGKKPRPTHSRSEPQLAPLSPEERERIMEGFRNPIWDKSLAERAEAEKTYWKWASRLKANAQCAVDHQFLGPMGGQTDVQRELIEKVAAEKDYWKWTTSLKKSRACTIDQAWGFQDPGANEEQPFHVKVTSTV